MRLAGVTVGMMLLALTAAGQPSEPLMVNRLPASLAGVWLFRTGHDPAWSSPFRERRNWQPIVVPGAWERQGYAGYNGHAWYRLSFFISSQLAGEELGVDLGVIGDADEVFLNGRVVGATGSAPPRVQMAPMARRFYALPREAVRFGEYNELAVHVFNEARFGGLLGPAPVIDRFKNILDREVVRDLLLYSLAALLATLAAFHFVVFLAQRRALEHLTFASFMVLTGLFFLAYASWGPVLLLGYNLTFRLAVVTALLAIALSPMPIFHLARRPLSTSVIILQTVLALAAAFSLVWRSESDLYLGVFLAEAALFVLALVVFRLLAVLVRKRHPLGWALLGSTGFLALTVVLDIMVDVGALPRQGVLPGELYSPLGMVPFALVLSLALAHSWVEQRWGEPVDLVTGLISRERFADRLGAELPRSRRIGHPLTVALLRVEAPDRVNDRESDGVAAVSVLRRALRQIDVLARYDRETFAILLVDTEERAAMTALERLRRAVSEASPGDARRLRCTAGVAQYRPSRHGNTQELLGEAEAALYAALSEGGGTTATAL